MNKYMELKFQVEGWQDVAVVNCSGRMVRGAALDDFCRRIEQLERVRVLVLDVSEVKQQMPAAWERCCGLRRWAIKRTRRRCSW